MEPPALVLVPSSPLDQPNISPPLTSSNNSSPISSDSSYATTNTPPSSYGISSPENNDSSRNSSESTIFSIYSMYSERRQTWRKSALQNSASAAVPMLGGVGVGVGVGVGHVKEYNNGNGGNRDRSRESGSNTDDGRPSESIADSFYRAPNTRSVSRQSSSGSGFFAGSAVSGSGSRSGSVDGSSPHQSYTHSINNTSNNNSNSPQSRTASRHVASFLDTSLGSTELPYASDNRDSLSLPNYGAPRPLSTSSSLGGVEADTRTSPTNPRDSQTAQTAAAGAGVESWADHVIDLTLTDDSHDSLPDLTMHRHSPASGKVHDSDRILWEKPSRPPRGSPPPAVPQSLPQAHAKSESTSTAAHYVLALSPGSSNSGHGVDAMSTTHEGGYVTAPQSVESSPSASTSFSPRFRVMNPDSNTPPTSSPSPPPSFNVFANHTHTRTSTRSSRSISSSQKGLPALPASPRASASISSPAAIPAFTPSRVSTPTPGPPTRPSSVHANRQSSVSSTPPPSSSPSDRNREEARARRAGGSGSVSSSLRRSRVPEAGEEPEAFFVRNTYAQLDVTGVKGDGYEEGVERTRAKLGHDRRSVQLAVRNDARGDIRGELSEEEIRILSTVDRYGFFNAPSRDRIVILPASSLSKPLQSITQTSTSSGPSPPILTSEPKPPPVQRHLEKRRISKWGKMLEAERRDKGGNVVIWRIKSGKERKLRSRVFKGIPDAWRAAAWEVLVSRFVANRKKESLDPARLENMLNELRREYRSSLDRPSSYDVQIDLDVPRTISGHVMFKTRYGQGQRSLFHTLHSFSLVCDDCGYCQGMGPIAATLLCYYEPEKVYSFLVHFHGEYEMHDIFLPGFPGLLEAIYVQERIMERMLPTVYAAFKKHMISTTSYATKWYITLFANTVPFQTQLRLWDAFLLDGRDVFVIVAVAIVWVLRDHLTSSQASFESILSLLSSFFVPEDEDVLLRWIERALDDKKLRGDMGRWRSEWRGLVGEKKDVGVLL